MTTRLFRLSTLPLLGLVAAMAVSGCQSKPPRPAQPTPSTSTKSAALRNMEQVAQAAYRCWFASGDPAFRKYSFANELNNFSGRPRFLLVPKNNYGGRPLLVVQAEGAAGRVETFGPLLGGSLGSRVNSDISRWSGGNTTCGSAA
jgi:hypothetical protein